MLSVNMSAQEMLQEVYADLEVVMNPSRLISYQNQYNRERKRKQIPLKAPFPVIFECRVRSGNNWMLMLSKPPSIKKYNGELDLLPFTYYHTADGIRVLKPVANPYGWYSGLAAYLENVFAEYAQKMNLDIHEPVDKVKHFMKHDSFASIRIRKENDRMNSYSVVSNGMLLGELQHNGGWLVHHTFLRTDELCSHQAEVKHGLLSGLQERIEEVLNEQEFNRIQYDYYADVATALNQ